MNKHRRLVTISGLLILLALCFQAYGATRGIRVTGKEGTPLYLYKDYHALVIGVGDYTQGWPDLPGAEKDAREVAAALEGFGFTVNTLMNPDSQQLKRALRETAFKTGGEENRAILFYFAGHGETLALADGTKLGYIIPTDCPLKSKDPLGFDDKAVSMKEIEALALKVHSKHLLMVFDSCFSGSLFNLVRAAPVEISEKSAKPVRQFITAGSAGEQVPDQSVFKTVFLDGIRGDADMNDDGYVTGSELGMALQGKVVNYTRGGQHPQYGKINNPKLDKGDFIFVPVKERAEAPQQDSEAKEAVTEAALLAEERKRLEEERRKTEALLEELKKARQEGIKQEQPRLAYAPKAALKPEAKKVTLRAAPKPLDETELRGIASLHGFFVMSTNPQGNFQNDFVDNKDGTITDRATGLMWEKKGSSKAVEYSNTRNYIDKKNEDRFAGHSDWRMPTMEELLSLLEPAKNSQGRYIDAIFTVQKGAYWSADKSRQYSLDNKTKYFSVKFSVGDFRVSTADRSHSSMSQLAFIDECHVLAVRTVKYASKAVPVPKPHRVTLRATPKLLSENELNSMLRKYGFFVMSKNPSGNFQNDFLDNGDDTITDRATGLMWERRGSSGALQYHTAKKYIEEKNQDQFAGHRDWRMPTLEELCSLLEPTKNARRYYISGFFEAGEAEYWSADLSVEGADWSLNYTVLFTQGDIRESRSDTQWPGFRPLEDCYIRAVRNMKK